MMKCRACFSDCELNSQFNIFNKNGEFGEDNTIAEVLSEVAHLQVSANEDFPNYICSTCCTQLKDTRSFIIKVHHTDALLRQTVIENNFKTTPSPPELLSSKEEKSEIKQIDNIDLNSRCKSLTADETDSNVPDADVDEAYLPLIPECNLGVANEEVSTEIIPETEIKIEIKQEPESYDEGPYYGYEPGISMEDFPTADHIKVEPLSKDAALMYHQGMDQEPDLPSLLNGYHEEHFLEAEIKPPKSERVEFLKKCQQIIKHTKKTYDCKHCGKPFKKKENKIKHEIKKHPPVNTIEKCLLCNRSFKSVLLLKHHVIVSHSYGEPLECEECNTTYTNLKKFLAHSETHASIKPKMTCYRCPNAKFKSASHLRAHLLSHKKLEKSDSTLQGCTICNRTFINRAAIISHFRHYHKKSLKEFKKLNKLDQLSVPVPKIKYRNRGNQKKVERKFQCVECKFRFIRKDHLNRHMLNVHKIKPVK